MLRRLLPIAALIILGACGNRGTEVNNDCDCGFYTNSSNEIMHWRDGSKIVMAFDKGFPTVLRPAVSAAAQTYDQLLSETSIKVDPLNESAPPMREGDEKSVSGDHINGIYFVTGEWPWEREDHGGPDTDDAQADAMTVVSFEGNEIVEADMFFKARSFESELNSSELTLSSNTFYSLSEIKSSELNVRWSYIFAIHEFGHVLGRVHTRDHGSIMYPKVDVRKLDAPFNEYDLTIFGEAYALKSNR